MRVNQKESEVQYNLYAYNVVIDKNEHTRMVDMAVRVLNSALEADRKGMSRLFLTEVAVNDDLKNHPTIQVGPSIRSEGVPTVLRVMGVINGLFGVDEDNWGFIYMTVMDSSDEEEPLISNFYHNLGNADHKWE